MRFSISTYQGKKENICDKFPLSSKVGARAKCCGLSKGKHDVLFLFLNSENEREFSSSYTLFIKEEMQENECTYVAATFELELSNLAKLTGMVDSKYTGFWQVRLYFNREWVASKKFYMHS